AGRILVELVDEQIRVLPDTLRGRSHHRQTGRIHDQRRVGHFHHDGVFTRTGFNNLEEHVARSLVRWFVGNNWNLRARFWLSPTLWKQRLPRLERWKRPRLGLRAASTESELGSLPRLELHDCSGAIVSLVGA